MSRLAAPRGTTLSCRGWEQESALRMLLNSADPDVAERATAPIADSDAPTRLQATIEALRNLQSDETLVMSSVHPGGVFRTQVGGPRVLVLKEALDNEDANPADWLYVGPQTTLPVAYEAFGGVAQKHFGGSLAGRLVVTCGLGRTAAPQPLAATLHGAAFLGIDADAEQIKRRVKTGYCEAMVNDLDEALRILKNAVRKREPASVGLVGNAADIVLELAGRGIVPNLLLDCTANAALSGSYIPRGVSAANATGLRRNEPAAYSEKTRESLEVQAKATLELKKLGSLAYRLGAASRQGVQGPGEPQASTLPDFSAEFVGPLFAQGRALLLWVALSGEPADISRADRLALEQFSTDEAAARFLQLAGRHVQFQGLPARACLVDRTRWAKFGVALNEMVAQGAFRAPILIGCDAPESRTAPPESQATKNAGKTWGDTEFRALLAGLSDRAKTASWVLESPDRASFESHPSLAIVADGRQDTARRIGQTLGK